MKNLARRIQNDPRMECWFYNIGDFDEEGINVAKANFRSLAESLVDIVACFEFFVIFL